MSHPIIEVKNIGKKYKITHERGRYVALRDVIVNVIKRPLAFLKDKARSAAGLKKKEEFWALRELSFNVNKGEVIGIIGHNGAGKSTLLKILSQITPPTEGEIVLHGRVGSLLEVGTGFHPELSGRENIFLNGAILGMTRSEIATKFDDIVEFAGIERFLDTPVKYYSSGMYVRLAFSVAAHMEPDILLVDEVLAVGDAEFQKKCLGKMDEITKKDGRTILFVSHNMGAIQELCPRSIVLQEGRVAFDGNTDEAIEFYLHQKNVHVPRARHKVSTNNGDFEIVEAWVERDGQRTNSVRSGDDVNLVIEYKSKVPSDTSVTAAFALYDAFTKNQLTDLATDTPWENIPGHGRMVCTLKNLPLNVGVYGFNVCLRTNGFVSLLVKEVAEFEVVFGDYFGTGKLPDKNQGNFLLNQKWNLAAK